MHKGIGGVCWKANMCIVQWYNQNLGTTAIAGVGFTDLKQLIKLQYLINYSLFWALLSLD